MVLNFREQFVEMLRREKAVKELYFASSEKAKNMGTSGDTL